MNTDNNRFDPFDELQEYRRKNIHPAVPPVLLGCFLLLLIIWSCFVKGCIPEKVRPEKPAVTAPGDIGSGDKKSDGKGLTPGGGPGSGASGQGPGAGEKGEKSGKSEQAQASKGTGTDNTAPGSAAPDQGDKPADTSGTAEEEITPLPQNDLPAIGKNDIPPETTAPDKNTGGSPTGRKGFYGVDVKPAGKVIFIVDTSSSMSQNSHEMPGKNRLGVLKIELKKAIFGGEAPNEKTYRRSGGFILIPFNSSASRHPAEKLYRYRKKDDMAEADRIIDQLAPCGGTSMKPAWTLAMEAANRENIDAIYFLSDGEPNDGFTTDWLLGEFGSRLKKIKVHTIVIGRDQPEMQRLAQECGGKYVNIP